MHVLFSTLPKNVKLDIGIFSFKLHMVNKIIYFQFIHSTFTYLLLLTAVWPPFKNKIKQNKKHKHKHEFFMTYHSRVAGVECGLEALLFSFSSSVTQIEGQKCIELYKFFW